MPMAWDGIGLQMQGKVTKGVPDCSVEETRTHSLTHSRADSPGPADSAGQARMAQLRRIEKQQSRASACSGVDVPAVL